MGINDFTNRLKAGDGMLDSNSSHDELRGFLSSNDAHALLRWSTSHVNKQCGHEYPHLHRIIDIISEDLAVRVMRCATCGERLDVKRIDLEIAHPNEPGVPYALSGEKLLRWISDEIKNPTKGPVNWDVYLKS